jgi:hypothetical protein
VFAEDEGIDGVDCTDDEWQSGWNRQNQVLGVGIGEDGYRDEYRKLHTVSDLLKWST